MNASRSAFGTAWIDRNGLMKSTFHHLSPGPRAQRGTALLIILLLLIVSGLMAVTAASVLNIDEKTARNARDQNVALQAAESALRDARTDIIKSRRFTGETGSTAACDGAGLKGFCIPSKTATPVWVTALRTSGSYVDFGEATSRAAAEKFKTDGTPGSVSQLPRYVIEPLVDEESTDLSSGPIHYVYRVTALGFGTMAGTEAIVQEVVRVP